jgi:hypothetical protein
MTTYYLKSQDVLLNLIAELQSLPLGKYEVCVKETGRTRRQEKYLHKLIGIIASHIGEDPDECKLRLKYEWLPLREISARGQVYLYPMSTTEITKDQYGMMITKTLALGANLGLVMPDASHFGLEER